MKKKKQTTFQNKNDLCLLSNLRQHTRKTARNNATAFKSISQTNLKVTATGSTPPNKKTLTPNQMILESLMFALVRAPQICRTLDLLGNS